MSEPADSYASRDSHDSHDSVTGLSRADLLLVLPFVWQLGLAGWANGVDWSPLGLPFGMFWQMAGILFATAVLGLRFALDRRNRPVTKGDEA